MRWLRRLISSGCSHHTEEKTEAQGSGFEVWSLTRTPSEDWAGTLVLRPLGGPESERWTGHGGPARGADGCGFATHWPRGMTCWGREMSKGREGPRERSRDGQRQSGRERERQTEMETEREVERQRRSRRRDRKRERESEMQGKSERQTESGHLALSRLSHAGMAGDARLPGLGRAPPGGRVLCGATG